MVVIGKARETNNNRAMPLHSEHWQTAEQGLVDAEYEQPTPTHDGGDTKQHVA